METNNKANSITNEEFRNHVINFLTANYSFRKSGKAILAKAKDGDSWEKANIADMRIRLNSAGVAISKADLSDLLQSSYLPVAPEEKPKQPQEVGDKALHNESTPVAVRMKNYLLEKYDFRFDVIAQEPEYSPKGKNQWCRIDDWEVNNIMLELESIGFSPKEHTIPRLLYSQYTPRYNALENYLNTLPEWNGTDYFKQWISFLEFETPKEKERFTIHIVKHFVRWIKCALEDGYFNKQAIVLVGKQNDGKTSLIRWLLPKQLKDYIKENPEVSKDGKIEFARNLLINYDEMASIEKNVIEEVKHMFSQESIKERPPFMRRSVNMKRYASIFGSTNHYQFLKDNTGSSRFLCFVITEIHHPRNPKADGSHYEQVGIDNLWAQAYHLYKSGYQCELTKEEIKENELNNRKHQTSTDAENFIQMFFEPRPEMECNDFITASEVNIRLLKYVTATYGIKPNLNLNPTWTGRAMTSLGFKQESKRISEKGHPIYGYYVYDRVKNGDIVFAQEFTENHLNGQAKAPTEQVPF